MIQFKSATAPFETMRGQFLWQLGVYIEEPYRRYLGKQLDRIIDDHEKATGQAAYLVKDTVYGRNLVVCPVGRHQVAYSPLSEALKGRHDDWVSRYNVHATQWYRQLQTLRMSLIGSKSWQDLRDMLPEHVMQPFLAQDDVFHNLPRTRPDLYAGDPSNNPSYESERTEREKLWGKPAVSRYAEVADTINLYVGYRLLS